MPYIVLGLGLLIGFILLARWFMSADPASMARALVWTLLVLGLCVGLFLLATGRLGWALAFLIPVILPLARRLLGALAGGGRHSFHGGSNSWAGGTSQGGGAASGIETRFLRMELDHATGAMAGTVLQGRHAGRHLDQMSLSELLDLLGECAQEDPESARVLESFLDRSHPGWYDAAGKSESRRSPRRPGAMKREEALEILGLQDGASPDEIKEAHRRMMNKVHPDHGGSSALAAKVNEAKDVLLNR